MYSLAITLFGAGQSSIRILELLSVLGTAALVATASGKDEPALAGRILPDGVFGFSALALAVFDVTLFGFWDTAQAEFWESAFVVASYASLVSGRLTRPASATSAVFAALATLMKPLALLALPIAFRAWRGAVAQKRTSTLLAFAVGFVAPLLLTAVTSPRSAPDRHSAQVARLSPPLRRVAAGSGVGARPRTRDVPRALRLVHRRARVVCLVKPNPVDARARGGDGARHRRATPLFQLSPRVSRSRARPRDRGRPPRAHPDRVSSSRRSARPAIRAPRSGRVRAPGLPWAVCRARDRRALERGRVFAVTVTAMSLSSDPIGTSTPLSLAVSAP